MMNEKRVRILLEDLKTRYIVGYRQNKNFESEPEIWGQIEILEWVLGAKEDEIVDTNPWSQ